MLAWIIVSGRLTGLRSFFKMTAFDFIVALATGSLVATGATATGWPALLQAMTAATVLLGAQYVIAKMRQRSPSIEQVIGNQPMLLMRDGNVTDEALLTSRVAREDVTAKLREATALDLSRVLAVVLETTGDISVLHGENVDDRLLETVLDLRRISTECSVPRRP